MPVWCYEQPLDSKEEITLIRADFSTSFSFLKNHEGGYTPNDEGSEAYVGINRKWNPDWYGWKFVDQATCTSWDSISQPLLDHYVLDYYLTIWVREGFDSLRDQRVANYLFDTRVHLGAYYTSKVVRQTGFKSMKEINHRFLPRLMRKRISFYNMAVAKYPSKKKYLPHWFHRASHYEENTLCHNKVKKHSRI